MTTNFNHQDTTFLHQLRSETVKNRQIAKATRVKIRKTDQDPIESSAKSQQFSELMKSERFLTLKVCFESLEQSLPSSNGHKSIQDENVQNTSFLAACALWWEDQLMKTDKDEDCPLQIQHIFEGLDSALMKQRARQNPWNPNRQK
ncbi:Uncharacterised protein [[Actinobacillus] rossii]|uniref:Uncharacterized protein n=1 Tax=[Actinobacillus] rossii TaxID=123820 RepID=A0A380TPN0_9PAST|nr:Uncharacterised protein [[Actinobacillus] rossii]